MKRLLFLLVILFPCVVHAGPSVRFETELHDFGSVKQGDLLECKFEFANSGTEDLLIKRLTAS
jgi:hypothetical protein